MTLLLVILLAAILIVVSLYFIKRTVKNALPGKNIPRRQPFAGNPGNRPTEADPNGGSNAALSRGKQG